MRQYCALGAAGRARRVKDCRRVVRRRHDRAERGGLVLRGIGERPSVRTECQHRSAVGDGAGHRFVFGTADNHPRLSVVEKIRQLAAHITRIEGQIHETGPQRRKVKREHLPMLVGLHRDAVARPAARGMKGICKARGQGKKVAVAHRGFPGNEDARVFTSVRGMTLEQRVEVGIHWRMIMWGRVGFRSSEAMQGRAECYAFRRN